MEAPELPYEVEYLWYEYVNIRKGCNEIDYTGLDAYQRVTGAILTPWEATLMLDIERVRKHG